MARTSNILGVTMGTIIGQLGGIIDKYQLTGEQKQRIKLELESLLQRRETEVEGSLLSEMQTKERVLVAELQHGDNYTKRARPTVVYVGLGFIFFNYCLAPLIAHFFGPQADLKLTLPTGFWAGWSGIVATWSVGRTFEKRGIQNRWTRAITGSRPVAGLFTDETAKG